MPERFLNLNEAAQILHISEEELNELVKQGKIPAYKIADKFLRFDKDQIEKYINSLTTSQTPSEEDHYSLREKIFDFFYYNDFYIFSFFIIALILLIIFFQ